MLNIIQQGGWLMWIIAGSSIFAGLAFLERLFHLHRAQIASQDFLDGIYNVLRSGNVPEAITLCEDTPGPVANVVRAAILRSEDDVEDISRAVRHAGMLEIPRLEKNLVTLATIAKLAPMAGLMGTVLGMISTFQQLHMAGPMAHAGDLSLGLWQALLTTAGGLAVAIPCYAGYNFLVSRVEALVMDMEYASSEILIFLVRLKRSKPQA